MSEKVIDLKEVPEPPVETKPVERKVIEAKPVTKLSEQERLMIIDCLKNGKPQPNFALRELKTGGTKLVKAVNKYPNLQVNQKAVDLSVAQNNGESKVLLTPKFTNEQMLIQQIMELNSKMEIIMDKHKKLKKKYKKIKRDIYVDVDEFETEPVISSEKVESKENIQNETVEESNITKPQFTYNDFIHVMTKPGNWRRKVNYQ